MQHTLFRSELLCSFKTKSDLQARPGLNKQIIRLGGQVSSHLMTPRRIKPEMFTRVLSMGVYSNYSQGYFSVVIMEVDIVHFYFDEMKLRQST